MQPQENESDRDDHGTYYVFSVYDTDYLLNTSLNAKFEDILNFKVNDTNVSMVVDLALTITNSKEKSVSKSVQKSCSRMHLKTCCPYLVSVKVHLGKLTLYLYRMHRCLF